MGRKPNVYSQIFSDIEILSRCIIRTDKSPSWRLGIAFLASLLTANTSKFMYSIKTSTKKLMQMKFYVYILRCSDGSYYTGHTDNPEKRLAEHHSGICLGYTATRLPVELLFSQDFTTREEALSAEQQIKGWSRSKKEAMM